MEVRTLGHLKPLLRAKPTKKLLKTKDPTLVTVATPMNPAQTTTKVITTANQEPTITRLPMLKRTKKVENLRMSGP